MGNAERGQGRGVNVRDLFDHEMLEAQRSVFRRGRKSHLLVNEMGENHSLVYKEREKVIT